MTDRENARARLRGQVSDVITGSQVGLSIGVATVLVFSAAIILCVCARACMCLCVCVCVCSIT